VAPNGSTVTIFVSRGPRNFAMPDVIGMTEAEATQELQGQGLNVQSRDEFTPNTSQRGRVIQQDPPRGTTVSRGQTVGITVGSAS
jgi:serine/threonine-protein kinase